MSLISLLMGGEPPPFYSSLPSKEPVAVRLGPPFAFDLAVEYLFGCGVMDMSESPFRRCGPPPFSLP